ncbi:uncharacterized mitochondrial protein AtMg00310-like [Vicia villosa]|uniref:uncharacterized mitochondrial protein AtMg00310-like n=1 Tax=Vicia villosa TaxID=3911 RepID=UPI00273ABE3B|nr:uncharacterized mitochondrial protein AtMg00310-like [Vicia villosa]
MPSYQLSFYKIPRSVMKDITAIQRRFLWNSAGDNNFISWISSNDICKSKEEGGMGIKHVGKFNKALLSKWPWRILSDEDAIWKGILRGRYGDVIKCMRGCNPKLAKAKESL